MARKQFLLQYPDGSKKHIGCAERDSLLLSREIKQIESLRYAFVGEVRTYHTFADLSALSNQLAVPRNLLRHFLPGSFIFDHKGRKQRELLETPDAMAIRIEPQLQIEAVR